MNLNAGQNVSYTEADGGRGKVSLSKQGSAFVRFLGNDLSLAAGKKLKLSGGVTAIAGIEMIDTGTQSALAISSRGGDGRIDVGGLTTDGPLKQLNFKSTRFAGTLTVGGTLAKAQLGSLTTSNVTIGGSAGDGIQLTLSLDTSTDSNITSGVPIKSLKAVQFVASGVPATLTAPAVTSIQTKGGFAESVVTTGDFRKIKVGGTQRGDLSGASLRQLAAGDLAGGTMNFTAGGNSIGKVSAKTTIKGTTIRTPGNIGSITANEITSARIYAGVDVSDDEVPPFLPTELAQFTGASTIGKLTVKTRTSQLAMAAGRLGKIAIGELVTDDAISSGLAATQIDQLSGQTPTTELGSGSKFKLKNLDDQASFNGEVSAENLQLGSFIVTLF